MSVARTPDALVLDIESCDCLAGCPGCGVIAQGHGRVVVEVIDAPWAGVPARIRWFKRRWICRETTCQTVTFLEHSEKVCAPRARLGVRAIRWAIRQLRFEGATIAGLARQLATTWNTVWSHIKPCLQAASDDPARFAGVQVLGVDEHVWHHQDRRRRGPRELTGIVDLTRGEDHPTARLLDLVPGRSGTVYKNWLAERSEDFRAGVRIATLNPFQGQQERHRLACSKTPPASSTPFTSSNSLATLSMRYAAASSKTHWDTVDAKGIPSIKSAIFCAPRVIDSRSVNKNASVRPSRQMKRISVSKSPIFTGQVRDVFHQDTPAQGRRLAARLIESLPRCPIPEIARLGRTLRKWKDVFLAYFDTDGASNAPHGSHQRNHRTRQTHRQRLPQPHQLPSPNAPHCRRPRRLHPHPTLKHPIYSVGTWGVP